MNTALKKHEPIINIQGLEPQSQHQSKQISLKLVNIIFAICAVTALAVYSTWLKFNVEEKYLMIEKIEAENWEMDERISHLEAEVESLMSFVRIENVLREHNSDLFPSERAFHINLEGDYEPVAEAGRRAPRPKGRI